MTPNSKGPNSMEMDPQLVDSAHGNFALRANSPTIDSGTDLGLRLDFSGAAVPIQSKVDIGTLEYSDMIATNSSPGKGVLSSISGFG